MITLLFLTAMRSSASDTLSISSPDQKVGVKVWMGDHLYYSISYHGTTLLNPSPIDLVLTDGRALSAGNSIRSAKKSSVTETITAPVPEKRKLVTDDYNLLTIDFKKPYTIEFRAYNDGVAYRISTRFADSIFIKNEVAQCNFPGNPVAWFPRVEKRSDVDIFHTSFEEEYPLRKLDTLSDQDMAYSPLLIANGTLPKVAITESDLEEYPGMFLTGTNGAAVKGVFAGYPLAEKSTEGSYPAMVVTKRAGYIAHTAGIRSFPWRALLIAPADKDLPGNDLVYRLASPSRIADASWVKPGKLTDEWTVDINLFNVPFRAGLNTASYKYYIDFAKRFRFDRIMMDAGWSSTTDLFKLNPDINIDTILTYAKQQGVKISMWTLAMTLDRQLDSALNRFQQWGVDFIMTDFMDRDDQLMVNFYHRIAKACADHKIMVMFHGAFPPKGFNRTWPNAVGREGLMGSEYNIWSNRVTPEHDVTLPYTRMLAGGLDYEPGILQNAIKNAIRPLGNGMPVSPGTRSHQLAMFAVYDSPMQIFAGNPSQGYLEPAFMELLGSVPVTWDETIIVDGRVGEFIVTARKKGNDWYIGGMTNWTERDITLSLDFLPGGQYQATLCKDGINADRYAADYVIDHNVSFNNKTVLPIHMAPGGGFLLKLIKQ